MASSFNFGQIKNTFKYKYFVWFFAGTTSYRIGMFIAYTAEAIQAEKLEGDNPLLLGLLGFAFYLPVLLLTPFSGVLADRINRIKLVRNMQLYFLLPTAFLTIATFTYINYWMIFITVFLYGLGYSLIIPAKQALIKDIVNNPKDLPSAIGSTGISLRTTEFIGSGIAGVIANAVNIAFCYIADFFLHIVGFILLLFVKVPFKKNKSKIHPIKDLKEGISYTTKHFYLAVTILFVSLNGLFVFPYFFQLPVVNSAILKGTPLTFGFMLAIGAIGGALAAIFLSLKSYFHGLTKLIFFSFLLTGVALIAFSLSKTLWISMILVGVIDFALTLNIISSKAFLQLLTNNNMLGKVMGFFTMMAIGLIPFGNLLYGFLGNLFGDMPVFFVAGVIIIIASIIYFFLIKKIQKTSFDTLYLEVKPSLSLFLWE